MIQKLRQVTDGLFRGSAPNPEDVLWLKDHLEINKIVSLDKFTGDRIDRVCKMLGIEHKKVYIDDTRASLVNCFSHDLKKLLLNNGPTYVHCKYGKDRTGLIIAIFKCKYMGMRPEKAIEEAKSLGFGLGVDPHIIKLYETLIKSCKPVSNNKDTNNADIVSNEREYIGDNRDSFLDEGHQGSFAPYLSQTRQDPIDPVYNYINDQSPTRENYFDNKSIKEHDSKGKEENIPQVGVFNNDSGIQGAGPTENYGGFFYD